MNLSRFSLRWGFILSSVLMALLCGSLYAQVPVLEEWTVPVTAVVGNGENFPLEFGKRNGATDGFDTGIDAASPPVVPGGSDAHFFISIFPNRLARDFRNPAETPKNWTLRAVDATGFGNNTLSWNTGDFPTGDVPGVLTISSPAIGTVNMLTQTSVTFTGTQQFTIHFEAPLINPPMANFTGFPLSGPEPLSVTFTDATTNTIFRDSYAWGFPGGQPANANGPGPHTVFYNSSGSFEVSLTVTNAAGSDTETKTGYVNVGQPDIDVVPPNLDFGLTAVAAGKTLSLTIHNASTASTLLEVSAITPPAGTDFGVSGVPPLPFTLAPGESQVIGVTFVPANEGAQNGNLVVVSNDPDESSLAVPLSGVGVSWLSPLTINGVSGGGNVGNFNLAFGGHTNATDGYDNGLDVPAPPPGFSYYAYFAIAPPVNFLRTDMRGWVLPFETDIDWSLRIVNADGITSEVCWQSGALPSEGTFLLKGAGLNIDMRTQNCAQVTGNAILTIEYRAVVCNTFEFPVASGAWYLVSLPVIPENRSLSSLFPGANIAFEWDYPSQNYLQVTQLEPEKAYWLLFLQTATVEVCGLPLNSYTHTYTTQGWELTGSVSEPTPLVDDPAGSIAAMYGWNPLIQNYVAISPFSVEPTQGYWILIFNTPCTVTVGSGGGLSSLQGGIGATNADLAVFYESYGALPPPPPYELSKGKFAPLPEDYGLLQNYPNPFNPETIIAYQLPEAGRVSLKIYTILGHEVRTLVDGEKPAGNHHVRWDGRDEAGGSMESGIYLYKLQAGGFVQTKKIILLK